MIIILIIVAGVLLFINKEKQEFYSVKSCNDECISKGFISGSCKWPMELDAIDLSITNEKIGSCIIESSKHCRNKGQCNCYCSDEQLVGGCAGVVLEHVQECCDNWARENNIFHIQCVGEWQIKDNECSWICS